MVLTFSRYSFLIVGRLHSKIPWRFLGRKKNKKKKRLWGHNCVALILYFNHTFIICWAILGSRHFFWSKLSWWKLYYFFSLSIRQGVRYSDHLSLTGILFWVPSVGIKKHESLVKLISICTICSEIMQKMWYFSKKPGLTLLK